MQFNSFAFALFLLPTLLIYYVTPRAYRWLPLLAASYLFYAASDARHIVILVGLTLSTYCVALKMHLAKTARLRLRLMWVGLGPIFITLMGFRCLPLAFPVSSLFALPLGLSFFSLRLASYLIDVHRGSASAERHFGAFSAYVGLFPELPAGPIDRAAVLLPQLRSPSGFRHEHFASGMKLFVWGLFKKLVIADRLRSFVDTVYDAPSGFDGAAYGVATLFFAFQIYCDFSGYSDMAIGLGEMFGLRFTKNFVRPYQSKSIAEFWTRWHITLSSWLRDYVFLPLFYKGGRALDGHLPRMISEDKVAYAIAVVSTMVMCGLWHGAGLTFITWGLVLAIFMVFSVITRKLRAKMAKLVYGGRLRGLHDAARVSTTFVLVNVAWVFFRANSLGDAGHIVASIPPGVWSYLCRILDGVRTGRVVGVGLAAPFSLGQSSIDILLALGSIALLLCVEWLQKRGSVREVIGKYPIWIRWPLYVTAVLAVAALRAPTSTKFIYAGF